MLEMGFVDTVSAIARAVPAEHQTLLFSATFPEAVRALSTTYQRDAVHVVVPAEDITSRITQLLYDVDRADRLPALIRILGHHRPESAIIFCNHRETCDEVASALARSGFAAVALHGGMEQHDRNTVLLLLKHGSLRVVVATDVAARGLDIDDLGAVINYDLPREPDVFVHRIGRTARAGQAWPRDQPRASLGWPDPRRSAPGTARRRRDVAHPVCGGAAAATARDGHDRDPGWPPRSPAPGRHRRRADHRGRDRRRRTSARSRSTIGSASSRSSPRSAPVRSTASAPVGSRTSGSARTSSSHRADQTARSRASSFHSSSPIR